MAASRTASPMSTARTASGRLSFAKIREPLEVPDLLALQALTRRPTRTLLRVGMTLALVALACLTIAPSLWALAVSTFAMGVASGMASPGYSAGASLAVSAREQGGIAGVINATGAITWIVAPVSATALYGWMPLSPFLLALSLVALSCACAWWLLHRADLEARARD